MFRACDAQHSFRIFNLMANFYNSTRNINNHATFLRGCRTGCIGEAIINQIIILPQLVPIRIKVFTQRIALMHLATNVW